MKHRNYQSVKVPGRRKRMPAPADYTHMLTESDPPGRAEVVAQICSKEMIEAMRRAKVILAVDETTGGTLSPFFGGRALQEQCRQTDPTKTVDALIIPLRQESCELEALYAAVVKAKGYCEYHADTIH